MKRASKQGYECSWPVCGCDPEGIDSPPCRAEFYSEDDGDTGEDTNAEDSDAR